MVCGPPSSSRCATVGGVVVDAVDLRHGFGCRRGRPPAGAIVAGNVDDERVVELAGVSDGVDDAAELVVALRGEAGDRPPSAAARLFSGRA